jgi:hypothetical protein
MPTATVLGCLTAARVLLQEAQRQAPESFGPDLEPLLLELQSEIESAMAILDEDLNDRLDLLLAQRFCSIPA